MQTGRSSILLPARKFPISEQSNPNFTKEVAELERVLAEHHGMLAYYGVDSGPNLPSLAELQRRLPLVRVEQFPDGSIWRLADSRSSRSG